MEAKGQLYQVGAHFEALLMGILTAASNLGCIFFRILTYGLEQCACSSSGYKWRHRIFSHVFLSCSLWSFRMYFWLVLLLEADWFEVVELIDKESSLEEE